MGCRARKKSRKWHFPDLNETNGQVLKIAPHKLRGFLKCWSPCRPFPEQMLVHRQSLILLSFRRMNERENKAGVAAEKIFGSFKHFAWP